MTNPYSTPSTFLREPTVREASSTRRLWIAYAISPLVAPLFAAIAVLVIGFSYQATHPEDVEVNPMSIIFAPIFLLILGVPASYGVAGLIGMPIAFWLRWRGNLNGYTVHGSALMSATIPSLALAILGVLLALTEPAHDILPKITEALGMALATFLALAPFILLSATTFWLIGVRQWKRAALQAASASAQEPAHP